MAHRESNDGITVAETFDRRESIADYLDELVVPAPAGRLTVLHVAGLPADWLEDYVATLEQRGSITLEPRLVPTGTCRVYPSACGTWPAPSTPEGQVRVVLAGKVRDATDEELIALAARGAL